MAGRRTLLLAVAIPLLGWGTWKALELRQRLRRIESRITFINGKVTLGVGTEAARAAVLGEVVPEGAVLVTPPRAEVDVGFGGGGGLKATGGTQISLPRLGSGKSTKEIELKSGALFNRVDGSQGKARYRVRIPGGQIMVRGTGFFVEVTGTSSLVATRDGEVKVSLEGKSARHVVVGAGEMVRMDPGSLGSVVPVGERERGLFANLSRIRELNAEGGIETLKVTAEMLEKSRTGRVIAVALPGGESMTFGYCPPGSFTMGSPPAEAGRGVDETQAEVRIGRGFWMGQMEVTQVQWQVLMGTTLEQQRAKAGSRALIIGMGEDHPMYYVTWEDARTFVARLNAAATLPEGWEFALPSEAQWEYACRAGTNRPFGHGPSLAGSQANFRGNLPYPAGAEGPFLAKAIAVGSYAPNAWLLYDMHGNVAEWCEDFWTDLLPGGVDPLVSQGGDLRIIRGGSWYTEGKACRAAKRRGVKPDEPAGDRGFRVAVVPSRS